MEAGERAPTSSDPADEARLRVAIEAHKAGQLATAETEYRHVLGRRPNDPQALMLLGILSWNKGDPLAAERLLRRSLEVERKNPQAGLNLGNLLLAKGDLDGARAAFVGATEAAPDLALAWLNLGSCLSRLNRPNEAAHALRQALKLNPGYDVAYSLLTVILNRQGNFAEAAEVYRAWHTHNPSNPFAKHMLAATSGVGAPERASAEYIRHTFDRLAADFDQHLRTLGYCAPELVAERLRTQLAAGARVDVLDAGCGTGLSGSPLRELARQLVGVDLSSRMIEKARALGLYDKLVVQEISEFMRSRPDTFDVVVCVDTFIYFGAIDEPLAAARTCLRAHGLMAFTAECLEDSAHYRLEQHGRYSHSATYVRQAAAQAGFTDVTIETRVLRRERGKDVMGYVALARVD